MRMRTLMIAALALGACGDDDSASPMHGGTPVDASSSLDATTKPDAAVDAPATQPSDCFLNPTAYLEIINACTDAEKVLKNPLLPLIGSDGKLPPLP